MYTPAWGLLKHIQKPPHGQTQTRPSENLLCKTLHFWRSGVTFQTCPAEKIYKPTAPKWVPIWGPRSPSLCDETKILTDTETETFYPRQIFPIPIPRLFFRDQIFRDRYRDFFSETKFSNTDTETFLTRPNFSIPIPRLFLRDQKFWYRNRDSQRNCHGSRDRDRDRDFCIWLTTDYRQLLANFSTFSL